MEKWTTENIPDLSGKIILITGGNSGLGFESAKAFAKKGAEVVIACRSLTKGEEAKREIIAQTPAAKVIVMPLDLMDLTTVKNFAEQFKKNYQQLDILMNNAGILMVPYGLTKDGFEQQMGTNHLGHFALTGLLLDVIARTPKSRVVNVSSLAHDKIKLNFDDLHFKGGKGYSPMNAYRASKLANLYFTYELQRRFESKGYDTISVAAHPGGSQTNLAEHLEEKFLFRLIRPLIFLMLQSAQMGALPQIRAAVDPSVKGGEYYGPDGRRQMQGYPVLVRSNKESHLIDNAKKLWEISQKETGVTFPF